MGIGIKKVACDNKEEALDAMSDAVRGMAHGIAMTKKSIVLSGLVTAEDFDIAFNRQFKKEWNAIKDLDESGYMNRVLADMLTEGLDLETVFGGGED